MATSFAFDACRDELISTASRIVAESGDLTSFDPASWVDKWLSEPLPALGTTPQDYILAGHDCKFLVNLLLRTQSGSYS